MTVSIFHDRETLLKLFYILFQILMRIPHLRKLFVSAVLDATGHIHDGILNGNVIILGNYESCLDIKVEDRETNGTIIQGFQ